MEIDMEFYDTVRSPHLSANIHTEQMLMVSGKFFLFTRKPQQTQHGLSMACLSCTLKAVLGNGKFFVALRLEDRQSDEVFFPIDKQVGLLSFEVLSSPGNTFLGAVDLGMQFTEQEISVAR